MCRDINNTWVPANVPATKEKILDLSLLTREEIREKVENAKKRLSLENQDDS